MRKWPRPGNSVVGTAIWLGWCERRGAGGFAIFHCSVDNVPMAEIEQLRQKQKEQKAQEVGQADTE